MYPMYPYPPYPGYPPQQLPTLDQLREHRKMLDEYEKEVLNKDKEKKAKKPASWSKLETIFFMLWFAPIIVSAEALVGLGLWQWVLSPALGIK